MAILAAMGFYGVGWCFWGLQPGYDGWVPRVASAASLLILFGASAAVLAVLLYSRLIAQDRDAGRPLAITSLGFAMGLMLLPVAQQGGTTFYAVNASILASLILALTAAWAPASDEGAPTRAPRHNPLGQPPRRAPPVTDHDHNGDGHGDGRATHPRRPTHGEPPAEEHHLTRESPRY